MPERWSEKHTVQFSSVAQSYLTVCDPMDCTTPGLPVHHQLPEFTQTRVHWVGDAIQPSILCRHLLLLPSIFPSITVFSNESVLHIRWPKYWSFSLSISLISFRMDWLDLLSVQGTLKNLLHYNKTETIHLPSMIKCVYIYKSSTFLNAIFSKVDFI